MDKDANIWLCTRRLQFWLIALFTVRSPMTNSDFMTFFSPQASIHFMSLSYLQPTSQHSFLYEGSPSFIPRLMKYHLHSESQLPSWGFAMGQQSSNFRLLLFLNLYIAFSSLSEHFSWESCHKTYFHQDLSVFLTKEFPEYICTKSLPSKGMKGQINTLSLVRR